ncbi:MAG TPA: SdpI family protein [Gemmatimonadaceae bacterium]|nr:SdpI family protein [Gemmatimonadaceae bacterium]
MRKWIPLLIISAAFIASAIAYPRLPEIIPTHWNMDGQPDDWSSRAFGALITPVILLFVWGFVRVLPAIDPRGANYAKFGGAFEAIFDSLMLFLLGMHIVLLRAGLGYPVQIQRIAPFGIGVLLIVIGNLLPRCRPNWFVGIRTPWTLSSDRVWEKTHRIGGRLFVAAGFLIAVAALFWVQWVHVVLITSILLATAAVLIYSYLEWKREQSPASAVG